MMRSSRHAHHACRCAHTHTTHTHYRRGSDCGICGPQVCGKFRAARRGQPVTPSADLAPVIGLTTFPATTLTAPAVEREIAAAS